MKKAQYLISALLGLPLVLHAANIVYDDFSGVDNAIVKSTQTNTGQTWGGSSNYLIDSDRLKSSASSAGHFLSISLGDDYFENNPKVYELSAKVDYSASMSTPSDYFSIGFTETTKNSPNANRTHLTASDGAAGLPAIAISGDGRLMVQTEIGQLAYDSGSGVYPAGSEYELKLLVDTSVPAWKVAAYVDGAQVDLGGAGGSLSYVYASNPDLKYVSVTSNIDSSDAHLASLDDFRLGTTGIGMDISGPTAGQFGTFVDGIHWTTVNTDVLSVWPEPGDFNGRTVDGYVFNPVIGGTHGFDDGYDMGKEYAAPPSLPISLNNVGDVFVSAQSQRTYENNDCGFYEDAQMIIRLNQAPQANSFAPPFIHWTGRTDWTPVVIDVAAYRQTLPVYSSTNLEVPPASAILERIDKINLYMIGPGPAKRYYGNFFPNEFSSPSGPACNYGRNINLTIGTAFLATLTDAYTDAEKDAILTRLLHMGIQWYEPLQHGGSADANGGINQFQFLPIAMYLHATNQLDQFEDFVELVEFNQYGHFFRWESPGRLDELAPHNDLDKLSSSRLRPIVSINGNVIEFETNRLNTTGDGNKFNVNNAIMTRPSDGATAGVIAMVGGVNTPKNIASLKCEINSQPGTPFQVGDLIYFQPQPELDVSAGVAEFSLGYHDRPSHYQPSVDAAYRPQILMTADAVAHQVFDIESHTDILTPMRDYVMQANNAPDNPLHSVWGTFEDPDGNSSQLMKTFWQTHAASLGL